MRLRLPNTLDALDRIGAKAFVSHQPVISDGQTMGTLGMRWVHARAAQAAERLQGKIGGLR